MDAQKASYRYSDVSDAERARQQEIACYLNAASLDFTTPDFDPDASPSARVSADPNLTALVQLGALRLGCDRSFLSLIDGATQYIIAEATPSTSLTNINATPEESGLYLGVTRLDATWGVCPETMKFFTDDTGSLTKNRGNIVADRTRYIIKDFHADSCYVTRPYVAGWPHMRSYAEVPVISPLGYVIGGYCVVDNKQRNFGDETISVLTEIAATIMSHLQNVRVRRNQRRSERLVRGMDMFIQEESAVREPSLGTGSLTRTGYTTSITQLSISDPSASQSAACTEAPSDAGSNSSLSTSQVLPMPEKPSQQFLGIAPDPADGMWLSADALADSGEVKKAFRRSARLIREAMGMDGLVFLDACPVGFSSRNPKSNIFDGDPFKSRQDDIVEFLPSTTPSPVLASSLLKGHSTASDIPEGLLYRMIRRFKQGKVFNADQHGPFEKRLTVPSKSGDFIYPTDPNCGNITASSEASELFGCLPEARSIIFLPLWHFQKEKWFAAIIGWTSDAKKSFDPSDVTYFNAFGTAITAEISRLETLAVSKAKSDFISSISHELRSPLHGVLASAELLEEFLKSPEENRLCHMIRSCGLTLLDTMNHLLDYAKINSLSVNSGSKGSNSYDAKEIPINEEMTNLSKLVEDVVESVYVGYGHENSSRNRIKSNVTATLATLGSINVEHFIPVLVTFDIAALQDWNFGIDRGAWKRIVMNIFGNALKYTPSGRINIKLDVVREGDNQYILFCVKDTGIGISQEFQKYKIFQPFAQENALSAGTGLGLCIVQQIVQQLGGKIMVQSERGLGTTISVSVPVLRQVTLGSESSDPSRSPFQRLRGLKLGFITPETFQPKEEELFGTAKALQDYRTTLVSAVAHIAENWAGMSVNREESCNEAQSDVYIIDDSIPSEDVSKFIGSLHPTIVISGAAPSKLSTVRVKLPLGPHKLAKVLINALDHSPPQMSTRDVSSKPSDHSPNVAVDPATSQPYLATPNLEKFDPISIPPALAGVPTLSDKQISEAPKPKHILLVDDNAINLKVLITLVKRIGCTYLTAFNGFEAVQLFKAQSPIQLFSYVFMDISMPVMEGFTATREIRAFEAEMGVANPVKIIALTGLGSSESEKEAFDSGMDMFLTKPVSLATLKKLLVAKNTEQAQAEHTTR
ncbi:hypothetical protein AA313_de0203991 [Arthrobotrys entomopaga]|nr:hypothetical protein AA313_de0203991 [Arthrobotrys entomopaga]